VKAATGETVTAEELGGADIHTSTSGVADHLAKSEEDALERARACIGNLNWHKGDWLKTQEPREPLYPVEDLYGIVPTDLKTPYDVREVIARLVDGSEFDEFKGPLRDHPGLWLRTLGGHACGHYRQQRHPLF